VKNGLLVVAMLLGLVVGMPMAFPAADPPAAPEDNDKDEVKVKLEDCPKAVQETIKKEVGSGTIEEIEKKTKDGKTVYEADATIDGKKYEIKVAEDGTLISKELDDDKDDGEDDNGGKDDDKDEGKGKGGSST